MRISAGDLRRRRTSKMELHRPFESDQMGLEARLTELNPPPAAIERTFDDIPEGEPYDHERRLVFAGYGLRYGIKWSELLQSDRVLIVSEAGAGKTYECRTRRDALWDRGEPAFYLDLATLAQTTVRDMLGPDEITRLDEWHASQDAQAVFFLDSYDELKLSQGNFEQALIRLAKELNGKLDRAKIVVTTRPVPMDRALIKRHLPVPPLPANAPTADDFASLAMGENRKSGAKEEPKPIPQWREVALLPLSDSQIVAFARNEGVTDTDELMADIRKRNAEDFARRPQDLIEICADWRAQHRLVTHREQMAANITIKLKPHEGRRERVALSQEKAFEGASRLALAAALSRRLTFRHNAEADRNEGLDAAIDPTEVLYDWSPDERQTLLERPLFGFATYGRVRFHHRSIVEFLAAERLRTKLADRLPIASVKRLLFTETAQGRRVVRPSMRPVAAWLAGVENGIYVEVLDREPEILLHHGDPQSLSPGQRIAALKGYVRRFGSGGWRGTHVPHLQEHRFADRALASAINEAWASGIENVEVRHLLLSLIEAGGMTECADVAFQAATNRSGEKYERLAALDALVALDDPRLPALVDSIAQAPENWPDDVTTAALPNLFPGQLSVAHLLTILRRFTTEPESGYLSSALPRLIATETIDHKALDELRSGLDALMREGLSWTDEYPHIKVSRAYLSPALLACCMRLLEAGVTDQSLFNSIALGMAAPDNEYDHREPRSLLIDKLQDSAPETRGKAFWAYDALRQSVRGELEANNRYFEATYRGPVTPHWPADNGWMEAMLADSAAPMPVRQMMLRGLLSYVGYSGDTAEQIGERLRSLVSDVPQLTSFIDFWLTPTPQNREVRRLMILQKRREQQQKRRQQKNHASWVQFFREIERQPDQVFRDDREKNTAWNLWQVMNQARGDGGRETAWNRPLIEEAFGKNTADRLRLALMRWWRSDLPTLASEREEEEKNRTLLRWQLGLAAITAEAEDHEWATKLTAEEARLAARYAPLELNHFPSWLGALAANHGQAVDEVLGAELASELEIEPFRGSHPMTLQKLSYAADDVAQFFLPRLITWLDDQPEQLGHNHDPDAAAQRLRYVLRIVLKHGDEAAIARIRELAVARASIPGPFMAVWVPMLLQLDPPTGVSTLAAICANCADTEVERWIGNLFADRRESPVNLKEPGFNADVLRQLAELAYRRVPIANDITHVGTFSPGVRDYAERGRSAIFGALFDLNGPEAWAAKLSLASNPDLAEIKDRALLLAEEVAAAEADSQVFRVDQIVALERHGESPPADRDGMFQIMRDRLDDLDDLLLRDDSPRESWALIEDEKLMRRAIAFVLEERRNGAYTRDQEAATADEKETDIRLRSVITPHQAVIELKIGDKPRSAAELRATIRDQLLNKYMAESTSRAGCLLITLARDRTWQHPDTGAELDFPGLIDMLQEGAAKIMNELGGDVRLMVKGLDLRPRLRTEREAKVGRPRRSRRTATKKGTG